MIERDPLLELKAENARLIALLEANGIQWRAQPADALPPASKPEPSRLSTDEKLALFRPLVPGTHGCLSDPLGRQDFGEIGLLAGLRQRQICKESKFAQRSCPEGEGHGWPE